MFMQLVLLYFIAQFGCFSQAIISVPSVSDLNDVASAAQTSQSSSSTQSCYKYDMVEEGCTSDNNCEIGYTIIPLLYAILLYSM